ncbi:MAG: outer membrane beta-barrel protein [Deltaproteobacteria bacterium]|nr:outer membrane beta-barrel protein [Deltaproteobacteria bacterium]
MIFFLVMALGILTGTSSYAQDKLAVKRIEPGRWAFSFKMVGDIPVKSAVHDRFKSGLGAGARAGYGFWQGLSVEGDFQYDRLFREGGIADDEGDKNLTSLAAGLRYTVSLLQDDIAAYLYLVPGFTFDYTKGAKNNFELSYAIGTGMDFNLSERLSVGPLVQFRHIFEEVDIYLVSVGAAFTYIFN